MAAVKTSIHIGAQISGNLLRGDLLRATMPFPPPQDTPVGWSDLGTPVFDNLIIQSGSYTTPTGQNVSYDEQTFNSALITLTQAHNVIITSVQNRDDEVIEYIGKFSFRINIKGGVFGVNNNRPIKDISNLIKILNSNMPIQVVANSNGGFLQEWNISQFVVLNKNIPQIAGGYNYQLFEFDAINDVPVILAQQAVENIDASQNTNNTATV